MCGGYNPWKIYSHLILVPGSGIPLITTPWHGTCLYVANLRGISLLKLCCTVITTSGLGNPTHTHPPTRVGHEPYRQYGSNFSDMAFHGQGRTPHRHIQAPLRALVWGHIAAEPRHVVQMLSAACAGVFLLALPLRLCQLHRLRKRSASSWRGVITAVCTCTHTPREKMLRDTNIGCRLFESRWLPLCWAT